MRLKSGHKSGLLDIFFSLKQNYAENMKKDSGSCLRVSHYIAQPITQIE